MLVWHGGLRQSASFGVFPGVGVNFRTTIRRGKKTKRRKPDSPQKYVQQRVRLEKLEAVQDGSRWFIPAGTKVKHGTSSNNLRRILEEGIIPGNQQGRSEFPSIEAAPRPASNGVYVASCYAAYWSSLYNFTVSFCALYGVSFPWSKRLGYGLRLMLARLPLIGSDERMFRILRQQALDKYVNLDKVLVEACGLPVVLNITLREDVQIQADEYYVPTANPDENALSEVSGSIWMKYGSTVLLHKIPPSWIDSVEHFETSNRGKDYVKESYVLSNEDFSNNPHTDAVEAFKVLESVFENAQQQALSRPRYERDLASAILGGYLCNSKPGDSRSQWFNRVVHRSQSYSAFSGKCPINEVPAFLDQLERNNKRDMLAFGYNLASELAAEIKKLG